MDEKLIIKNFGPISDIELDLKKINIFIGPNASGKSTISKLIAIVKDIDFLIDSMFHEFTVRQYFSIHSIKKYFKLNSKIQFVNSKIDINLKETTKSLLKIKHTGIESIIRPEIERHTKLEEVQILRNSVNEKFYAMHFDTPIGSLFVPAERQIISALSNSLFSIMANDINLPKSLLNFGNKYEKARNSNSEININQLGINYTYENNQDYITVNGVKTILGESASGFQATIPMALTILNQKDTETNFVIEEPELNLFPKAQKGIVDFLVQNCTKNNSTLTINTHSPYVLTALNNLIEAHNTYKELCKSTSEEDAKQKVSEVIKSDTFINFDDIGAWYVNPDGTVKDIKDYETKLIDAELIDSVSDILSDEFDGLLNLQV